MGLKYKIIEKLIHHRNYFNKGMELAYYLKTFVQYWVYSEVMFKLIWTDLHIKTSHILIGLAVIVAGAWFLGYLWDRAGIFVIEAEWGNKRNLFVKEMRKKYNIGDKKDGDEK